MLNTISYISSSSDRNAPLPADPCPSPLTPTCPFFSYYPSLLTTATTSRTKRKSRPLDQSKSPEEIVEEFQRVNGRGGMYHLVGSPYSQGLASWRMLLDRMERWRKYSHKVALIMKEKSCGWPDKYRPKALDDFICHRDKTRFLRAQVAKGVLGHFIFEGPPGVGKKTMALAFLREAFGPEILKTKVEWKNFEFKGEDSARIKILVTLSPHHIEIDLLSKLNGYEKDVITSLIEEHCKATECDYTNSRAIVLYHADQLCEDTQNYIHWIMERHQGCHKILFCCTNVSNLQVIRSICTVIQLLPPSNDEIVEVLEHIAEKEGLEMPHHLAQAIAKNSKQNLRQVIRSFESSSQAKHSNHQIIQV